jgi:alkylation response protein AidB-like acyl-CoA dehydrogenase
MSDPRETVEEFRVRARAWLASSMPRLERVPVHREHRDWARQRVLQRMLWDGGFAGICFPREYGGLGLPIEYQHAFTEESLPYELPFHLGTPTFSVIAATLLHFGTHEQKSKYLPGILQGEIWVQLLSEPTGGSDLAGCLTRSDRDGDTWVLNGSKIWSSGADASDYGLCVARTNWDVPKHRGLSVFIVDLHQSGVTIEPITQVNGERGFCQVFLDDVVLPSDAVVGAVDEGWTVVTALLSFERDAVGGSSPYISGRNITAPGATSVSNPAADLARTFRVDADPVVRQLIGEQRMVDIVQRGLVDRISLGLHNGAFPAPAGALLRLFAADANIRKAEIAMTIAGAGGVAWSSGDAELGGLAGRYLVRQADSMGGGTSEMQRNIISERLLGLPREWAADRDVPYRDVRRGPLPSSPSAS